MGSENLKEATSDNNTEDIVEETVVIGKVEENVEPPPEPKKVEIKVEQTVEAEIEPKIEEKDVPSKTLKEDTEHVSKTNVETIVKPDVKAPDTLDVKEDDEIIKSESPPSPIPVPTGGFKGAMTRWETTVTQSSSGSTPAPKSPLTEVGSIKERMTFYKNNSEKENQLQKTESVPASVGSLADKKNIYLNNNRTASPTPTSSFIPKGSEGLKERMKAYQNNKSSNLVRRETVASGERASDIKSRIMGWGCQKDDKKNENIQKPGKINDRLNQYQKNALNETEQEI